jgi:hypothetical protein
VKALQEQACMRAGLCSIENGAMIPLACTPRTYVRLRAAPAACCKRSDRRAPHERPMLETML